METPDQAPAADPQLSIPLETPQATPEPPADTESQLAAEREARIRLEGKVEGLAGAVRPTAPQQAPPPQITPDLIEQAFARGDITEAQRIQHHANLVAGSRYDTARHVEREAWTVQQANAALNDLIAQHPDLGDGRSELIGRVKDELRRLGDRDPYFRHQDPRHQLIAVERVLGVTAASGGAPVSDREFQRRRAPSGGTGSGGAAPGGPPRPGSDPLKGVPADTVAYWRSHGWVKDADSAKRYAERWHAQAARRRARLAGA